MLESAFQAELVEEIADMLPDCEILVKPGYYLTGFPDLMILWNQKWAVLEVKKSEDAPYQPGQEWWLERLNDMSFSATIYPENKEEVLRALQSSLRGTSRQSRRPLRQ